MKSNTMKKRTTFITLSLSLLALLLVACGGTTPDRKAADAESDAKRIEHLVAEEGDAAKAENPAAEDAEAKDAEVDESEVPDSEAAVSETQDVKRILCVIQARVVKRGLE